MSFRKTKLIQEKNILLERKYISEQGPVPPPPAPVQQTPTTTPSVSTPSKKFTIDDVMKTPKCSKLKTPPTTQPTEIQGKDGKKYNYYLTSKNDMVLCYDEITKQ
jgi:hypothetical protein